MVLIGLLPAITSRLIARYGNRTAAIRTKWILLVLCGLGAWRSGPGSEAVLPAYLAGMVLAKTVGRDHFYIRRLRTLTVGFLDAVLFPPRRLAGLAAGAGLGAAGVPGAVCRQVGGEDLRPLSRHRPASAKTARSDGTTR